MDNQSAMVINDNVPLLFEPVTLSMTSVMVKGVSGDW